MTDRVVLGRSLVAARWESGEVVAFVESETLVIDERSPRVGFCASLPLERVGLWVLALVIAR